jgi:hypothetical protein
VREGSVVLRGPSDPADGIYLTGVIAVLIASL